MARFMTIRNGIVAVLLTAVWCGLWGSVSFANVAGGLALAMTIVRLGFGTPGKGSIRFVPLLRLTRLVLADLASSTVSVAREVLTPTDYTDEGIIAVDIPEGGRDHLLLLVVAITVTPGTAVVEVDREEGKLYLHLLHIDRRQATEAHVKELAELAAEALPAVPEARSADRPSSHPEATT